VPDITVFHKGSPIYFFEIVHTSAVSEEKLRRMKKFSSEIEIVEIEAEEILRHCNIPNYINCTIL
jgi:hypothetical protein